MTLLRVPGPLPSRSWWADLESAIVEDRAGPRRVVLDFGQASRLEAEGLRVILACRRTLEQRGGGLAACRLAGAVRRLFLRARLHELVDVYSDAAEARADLARVEPDETPALQLRHPVAGRPPLDLAALADTEPDVRRAGRRAGEASPLPALTEPPPSTRRGASDA